MLYLMINTVLTFFAGLTETIFLFFFLTPRKDWKRILPFFIPVFYFFCFMKCATSPTTHPLVWGSFCSVCYYFFALYEFCENTVKKMIYASIILWFIAPLSDLFLLLTLKKVLQWEFVMDYYSKAMVIQLTIGLAFTILSDLFIALIYTFFIKKKSKKIVLPIFFFTFLLFDLTAISILWLRDFSDAGPSYLFLAPVCFTFAAILLFLLYFLESKTKRASDSLFELQKLHELEAATYQEIELQSETYAKIRHDYNNQLNVINSLIESGDYENAKKFAEELRKQI